MATPSAQMTGTGVTAVQTGPNLSMEDLRSKYNQVVEENKVLKREIQSQQQQLSQLTSSRGNQSLNPSSLLNSQSQNESQLTESQIEERIMRKYKAFKEELEQKTL